MIIVVIYCTQVAVYRDGFIVGAERGLADYYHEPPTFILWSMNIMNFFFFISVDLTLFLQLFLISNKI